jgi:predicted ATPase
MHLLNRIELKGYKSIKEMDLELRPLNVLIGANGSGKSNLISFFKLLNHMMAGSLQAFVGTSGGANSLLHYGAKATPEIEASLHSLEPDSGVRYKVRLGHAPEDALVFVEEGVAFPNQDGFRFNFSAGGRESQLRARASANAGVGGNFLPAVDRILDISCAILV